MLSLARKSQEAINDTKTGGLSIFGESHTIRERHKESYNTALMISKQSMQQLAW